MQYVQTSLGMQFWELHNRKTSIESTLVRGVVACNVSDPPRVRARLWSANVAGRMSLPDLGHIFVLPNFPRQVPRRIRWCDVRVERLYPLLHFGRLVKYIYNYNITAFVTSNVSNKHCLES